MKTGTKRPVAFVVTATNHGSMLVNRFDYKLVPGGGYGVGYQLLDSSSFDQEEVDFVIQLLIMRQDNFGDGVVAIDCGANIGVHTIEWARQVHGWGEVLAIEAQERIFYALAGNITMNNCFNARAIWAAVGAVSGSIEVPVPNYFLPSSFGSLEIRKTAETEFIGQDIDYAYGEKAQTKMIALDKLGFARVDFIKIDIEGMEMEALEGARRTLAIFRPAMLIEKIKSNERELREFLTALGYRIFPMGLNLLAVHESDPAASKIRIS